MAVELSKGINFTPEDIAKISEAVVSHIENNDSLSFRLASSLMKTLAINPDLGAEMIDALQDQFPQSVLSKNKILEARDQGWVVIEPLTEDRLQTSSYDVSIGPWFWVTGDHPGRHIFNPLNQDHIRRLWGGRPRQALTVLEHLSDGPFRDHLTKSDFRGNELDDQVIVLRPGETILTHTSEFIGARYKATEMMKARSSYGRCFLAVCKDAGWGDIGYFNRWTMEIHNDLKNEWTFLTVGQPIGQMVFFRTNPIEGEEYSESGSYQGSKNLETLTKEWNPNSMLPVVKRKTRVI